MRAAGAFARNAAQIEDAYTAAAVLASGAVQGKLADDLRAKVRAALQATDDGAKILPVGEGVVRGDGRVPSTLEATALAVLALAGDAVEEAAAELMARTASAVVTISRCNVIPEVMAKVPSGSCARAS